MWRYMKRWRLAEKTRLKERRSRNASPSLKAWRSASVDVSKASVDQRITQLLRDIAVEFVQSYAPSASGSSCSM